MKKSCGCPAARWLNDRLQKTIPTCLQFCLTVLSRWRLLFIFCSSSSSSSWDWRWIKICIRRKRDDEHVSNPLPKRVLANPYIPDSLQQWSTGPTLALAPLFHYSIISLFNSRLGAPCFMRASYEYVTALCRHSPAPSASPPPPGCIPTPKIWSPDDSGDFREPNKTINNQLYARILMAVMSALIPAINPVGLLVLRPLHLQAVARNSQPDLFDLEANLAGVSLRETMPQGNGQNLHGCTSL